MNKKDWLAERRKGIGGSDAAAILGFSPWKSPMDVYLEKTGMVEDKPEDKDRQFLLDLGQDLEPVVARLYERETGKRLLVPGRWQHPNHPVLVGTPDRVVEGLRIGVELKTENQFQNEFGEPGSDQVPYHYLVQCLHYMAVGNYGQWDVAVLHGGARFAIYHIQRNVELEEYMVDELLQWWDRHIVQGQLPEVDASPAWKSFLRQKYPANVLPILPTDQDTLTGIENLATARRFAEYWDIQKTVCETRLKLAIGDHEGFVGEFGKLTWRRTKDGQHIDWQSAFNYLTNKITLPGEQRESILGMFTHTTPGTRRFLFTPRKDWLATHGQFNEGTEARKLPANAPEIPGGTSAGAAETSGR